jgi:hypothetical protein
MINKRWNREMKRYRVMEHTLRDKSVFIIEWNDRWFFGIWGRWHPKVQTLTIQEAIRTIHKLVTFKLKK